MHPFLIFFLSSFVPFTFLNMISVFLIHVTIYEIYYYIIYSKNYYPFNLHLFWIIQDLFLIELKFMWIFIMLDFILKIF